MVPNRNPKSTTIALHYDFISSSSALNDENVQDKSLLKFTNALEGEIDLLFGP